MVGAAVIILAVSFAVTSWALSRLEHRAYDVLVTTVEIGCEAGEIRQVGVEVYLWHTDLEACVPRLTRADVERVGDGVMVTLFEKCRGTDGPPVIGPPGMLPRYVFILPVRWKLPGPVMFVNEYAQGRLTAPRPVTVNSTCWARGPGAAGAAH